MTNRANTATVPADSSVPAGPAGPRRKSLHRRISERGFVIVAEIAREIGVSDMTVRRDLEALARDGLVQRTHGGAVLAPPATVIPTEPSYAARRELNPEAKRRIAAAAAAMVSAGEAIEVIRNAQTKGLKIYGETCPQYLFLTADDLARPGVEGAKFCCSPPPRDKAAQQAVWTGLKNGTFQVFSSDHAPYRFDASGKLPHGDKTTFKDIANGVPGIELRLPLLFSEGVGQGRLDLNAFVALTATNHAKLYGLYPKKGTIAVGSDADLAIWDPQRETTVTAGILHDNVGYTPYEGRRLRGWPVTVLSRGRILVDDGKLVAARGSGAFLPCALSEAATPAGNPVPELGFVAETGAALV